MTISEELREMTRQLRESEAFSCWRYMEGKFGIECEGAKCSECYARLFENIADRIDAECALPDGIEWPRFEDGELVKPGDEVEFEGETMRVLSVAFTFNGWVLWCARESFDGRLCGSYGELVKRPTPKVLDADGAPISVGDTVYCDDDPEPLVVDSFDDPGCVYLTSVKGSDGTLYTIEPSLLTHKRPDSWEQLEKDAYHLVMSEYLETTEKDVGDIVRRAKALAKAGE